MIHWLARARDGSKTAAVTRLVISPPIMIPAGIMALIWLGAASPVAPLIALPPICLGWIWLVDLFHVVRGSHSLVTYKPRPWYFFLIAGCIVPMLAWAAYLQHITE